jgi:hypothetical protein
LLWGQLALPDDPKLAGQTIQVKMELQVVYLKSTQGGVENTTETITHTATLLLATDQAAGTTYITCYLLAGLGGLVLASVASGALVLRTKSVESTALPTEVHFLD